MASKGTEVGETYAKSLPTNYVKFNQVVCRSDNSTNMASKGTGIGETYAKSLPASRFAVSPAGNGINGFTNPSPLACHACVVFK